MVSGKNCEEVYVLSNFFFLLMAHNMKNFIYHHIICRTHGLWPALGAKVAMDAMEPHQVPVMLGDQLKGMVVWALSLSKPPQINVRRCLK
jgi:hypothetical protein